MHRLIRKISLHAFVLLFACACSQQTAPLPNAAAKAPTSANQLEMKLDGITWKADRELFGAVDPTGIAGVVLMAGSIGPKDANEQVFNLNVAGVHGPGRYRVHSRDASVGHAAQLANLSRERYLIGGVLGFDLTVDIATVQKNPLQIDAHFSGSLTANDGATIVVTDGRFHYSE